MEIFWYRCRIYEKTDPPSTMLGVLVCGRGHVAGGRRRGQTLLCGVSTVDQLCYLMLWWLKGGAGAIGLTNMCSLFAWELKATGKQTPYI